MRLLVAEDDPRLLKTLLHIFRSNHFMADGVSNGTDALIYAESGEYDGLILDIMMPGLDGIQVLQTLRKQNITAPALFLTARTEVEQRVEGLDAGADDYLPKPFAAAELLARTRAMLRRKENYVPDLLRFYGVTLNRSTYQLIYKEQSLTLSGKEFQIFEILMQKPHMVVSTEQFLSYIWGWDSNVDTSVVWVHISNVRKKICAIGAPLEIRFVRSAGYVLEEAMRSEGERMRMLVNQLVMLSRMDEDPSRTFDGSFGIGLSIAGAIAKNHHGDLTAYQREKIIGFKVEL